MLTIKTWYLPHIPGISPEWADYSFEGISILANTGATLLAMLMATLWLPATERDQKNISRFFRALDKPISAAETEGGRTVSARPAIGSSTAAAGLLPMIAALFSGSKTATLIDCAVGLGLGIMGLILLRRRTAS